VDRPGVGLIRYQRFGADDFADLWSGAGGALNVLVLAAGLSRVSQ
jgi:hypothetical protein